MLGAWWAAVIPAGSAGGDPLGAATLAGMSDDLLSPAEDRRSDLVAQLPDAGGTLALKEWGAAIHALLAGRQQVLLRKGGIHEKAFIPPGSDPEGDRGRFLLFPTMAHTHAERTRPEHHDLLAPGAADVADDALTIRAGVRVVDVVGVQRPWAVADLLDLHIWTQDSIQRDRLDFRPRHPLHILVVQAVALPRPVTLPRIDAYAGCRSWLDVVWRWDGRGEEAVDRADLEAVAERVRATVG